MVSFYYFFQHFKKNFDLYFLSWKKLSLFVEITLAKDLVYCCEDFTFAKREAITIQGLFY